MGDTLVGRHGNGVNGGGGCDMARRGVLTKQVLNRCCHYQKKSADQASTVNVHQKKIPRLQLKFLQQIIMAIDLAPRVEWPTLA